MDLEFLLEVHRWGHPYAVAFTKADKVINFSGNFSVHFSVHFSVLACHLRYCTSRAKQRMPVVVVARMCFVLLVTVLLFCFFVSLF